ncbi:DUF6531 domain-containing protein [Streptomyces hoynatensis]|uniref:DUF6531 domain-containing protein n=1 Tax=Streptomyces hoynatensis TaxID=1141874 RepID=UPI0011C48C9F|nr:DUF6531 domain-containing protein [Streptomyces hoynatensis]
MVRASDWSPVDMDSDPAPGDPERVRELAESLQSFADDVGEALGKIRGMASDRAVLDWAGLAAETFRAEFDTVPGNLTKLQVSYDLCAQALHTYWPKLLTAQGMADRALERAIAAQGELTSARGRLGEAEDWVGRAAEAASRLSEGGGQDAPPPDEAQVRAATRDHAAAQEAAAAAQSQVHAAEDRLAAARQLAQDALEMREEAARICARDIDAASDAGIHNRSFWENLGRWLSDAWDTLVAVCKVVVAVLGVIALIIGGPLALVVLAAAVVVLADTLVKFARGDASLLDVAFAALGCIPGMRGLTTLGGLARGIRAAAATGLRGLRGGIRGLGQSIRRLGRGGDTLVCRTDPIDMATGEVVLDAVDVELPGVLPLVLRRHHRSSLREGTWFGPSWASTLDQRLVLDEAGLRFVTEDGMVLDYPRPQAGEPVLPVEGPRWGLSWDGEPGSPLTVHQPETGHTLHFAPVPGRRGGELPLAALTDRNGNRIRVEYGPGGEPTALAHDGGYVLGLATEGGRITELRLLSDPEQPVLLRYGYDAQGNLAALYDSADRPQLLEYDAAHRLTGWEDRNGDRYRYVYDAEGRCVATEGTGGFLNSRVAYEEGGRAAGRAGEGGAAGMRRTRFTDSLGHTTVYEFDDCYRLVTETDPLGHRVHRTWDRYDRLLSLTDALGHTVRMEWDAAGCLAAVRLPDGTASLARHNALGLPVELTAHDGAVWRQEWDERGNCLSVTAPDGTTTTFTREATGALRTLVDAEGGRFVFTNDAAGRPTSATDPLGGVTRFCYDAHGRTTAVTDPLGGTTRYTWTPEGHPASRTTPEGATEEWTWDGEDNCLSHTDPLGRVTRFAYSPFGMLAGRTGPGESGYTFTHDTELRLTRVTGPGGRSWDYAYDAAGRLVFESDFDGHAHRYAHDAAGRLVSRTNAAGQTVSFRYDSVGNQIGKTVDGRSTTYEVDAAGRLLRAAGPDATLTCRYDPLGRVLAEAVDGRTVSFAYDALGRPTRRTTPGRVASSYAWDAAGNRTLLTAEGHRLTFAHDAAGRETTTGIGREGPVLSHSWDGEHRLTAQTLTARGRTLARRSWTYRADGSPTAVEDLAGGRRSFGLDQEGRVTAVRAEGWRESYAYDAAGNQTRADWPDRHPLPEARGDRALSGNRVTRAGAVTYEYDAAGRVVVRRRKRLSRKPDVWRFEWDGEDRLTAVTTPDGTRWRYRYDPLGRRVAKQRLGPGGQGVAEETRFAWDGPHLVEQTTTAPGGREQVTVTWEREDTRPLAQLERTTLADAPQEVVDERFFAIVGDLVGTPTELVGEDGEVAWRAEATLWGLTGRAAGATAYTPLRFPGQYEDRETGLHYNCLRHYDPATAAYLSPDPVGIDAGPNPLRYVLNPLRWIDYLGLLTCAQNARRLRSALRRDGRPVRPGHAAAHIVPGNLRLGNAASTRNLLRRYGVDINEAANGIVLRHPRPHNFTHRTAYLNRLDQHLQNFVANRVALNYTNAAIRQDLRSELRRIGRQIQQELRTGRPRANAFWTGP